MRSPYSDERQKEINNIKPESVEEFLARGGSIQKTAPKKRAKRKIDAQALLDAAMGTDQEQEVIRFLATQGIDVE